MRRKTGKEMQRIAERFWQPGLLRVAQWIFAAALLVPWAASAQTYAGGSDLAAAPPMGWANWNSLGCNYNEDKIRDIADRMVSSGMREAGYRYLIIQECIVPAGHRDATGVLLPDPQKFPHGISALVAYIHSKGLKAGIYTDLGTLTCAKYEEVFSMKRRTRGLLHRGASILWRKISASNRRASPRHNFTHEWRMQSRAQAGRCCFTSVTGVMN